MADLRTVLVDDEQLARDELGFLLGQLGGIEVIAQAGNGVEALSTIDRLQPEVADRFAAPVYPVSRGVLNRKPSWQRR